MATLISSIGKRIKHYRTLNKISLSALAKEAKVSKSTLFGLELGETNPTIATLESIANALKIDISELINTQKESSLTLLHNPSSNQRTLYQLNLAPFESYHFSSYKSSACTIELIDGSLLLNGTNILLMPEHKVPLANTQKVTAGKKGAIALIQSLKTDMPLLIDNDILPQKAASIDSSILIQSVLSYSIVRIFTEKQESNLTIDYPSITTIQKVYGDLRLSYYFTRYIGYKDTIKKSQEFLQEKVESTLEYLELLLSNTPFNEHYCQSLSTHPLHKYQKQLEQHLAQIYTNLTPTTLDRLLRKHGDKGEYYLINIELLSKSQDPKIDSLTLHLYRAIENMVLLDEKSLPDTLRNAYHTINITLPEILYYAVNKYSEVAYTLTLKLLTMLSKTIDCSKIEHFGFKIFYCELYKELEKTLQDYQKERHFWCQEILERLLADLGAHIVLKQLIAPAIKESGRYLYLIRF